MRISFTVRAPSRPRNGHVPALVGRKSGAHQKSTKAKRKADKMALRKLASTTMPVDHSACARALRPTGTCFTGSSWTLSSEV